MHDLECSGTQMRNDVMQGNGRSEACCRVSEAEERWRAATCESAAATAAPGIAAASSAGDTAESAVRREPEVPSKTILKDCPDYPKYGQSLNTKNIEL